MIRTNAVATRGRLAGQVAVVTGAGRGIGRAIAEAFAVEGAHLALCARTQDELDESASAIHEAARGEIDIMALRCDVGDGGEVARFAAQVRARLGEPSLIVNNAGHVTRGRLDEQDPREWFAVVDVNLLGVYRVTHEFLPAMRASHGGRIINIASISGRLGTPLMTAYCAAKHGVIGITRALAEEVRDEGIQVNAICPGSVDTKMLEGSGYEPLMTPADVARVALFLAADAPRALTGACLDVFG